MFNKTLQACFIHDGKAGHLSQLIGLKSAMEKLSNLDADVLPYNTVKKQKKDPANPYQLIISAGSKSQKLGLRLAHQHQAVSVSLMKPRWRLNQFDFIITPKHDKLKPAENILLTEGALSSVKTPEQQDANIIKDKHLILLGGPSKHYAWECQTLIEQIKALADHNTHQPWQLFSSRRTPQYTLEKLQALALPNLSVFTPQHANRQVYHAALETAKNCWVSPDSVSLLYEALTAGAQVGLLSLAQKRKKLAASHQSLCEAGHVTMFTTWQVSTELAPNTLALDESLRSAQWLLNHLRQNTN